MPTHEVGIVPFTDYSSSNWRRTRPRQSWKPFGGDHGAKGKDPTYFAHSRDGLQQQIVNNTSPSDTTEANPQGIWTSAYDDGAYMHMVNHKTAHSSFTQLGWDSNDSTSGIRNSSSIAPITNFSGMAFKWDRRGSFWDDSSIRIDDVFFTIYDGETDNVYQQRAELGPYKGLNPTENGDPNALDNNCYFKTNSSDWSWCSNKKRYLVGITIQFYQKARGSASHSRVFRIYDLQPIYGGSAIVGSAKQVLLNHSNYSAIAKAANGGANRIYLDQ